MSTSSAAVRAPARPVGRAGAFPNERTAPNQRTTERQRPVEPRLRVVAPRVGRSRARLATLCVGLLAAGLVTLLMLTINLGSGAYTLTQLQRQQRDLTEQQQALAEQVEALQAPQDLARRAAKLGMVEAPNTTYLRLPDGKVEGTAAAAVAPPKPAPKVTPGADSKTSTKAGAKTGSTAAKGAAAKQQAAKQNAAKQNAAKQQAAGQNAAKQPGTKTGTKTSTATGTKAAGQRKTNR